MQDSSHLTWEEKFPSEANLLQFLKATLLKEKWQKEKKKDKKEATAMKVLEEWWKIEECHPQGWALTSREKGKAPPISMMKDNETEGGVLHILNSESICSE